MINQTTFDILIYFDEKILKDTLKYLISCKALVFLVNILTYILPMKTVMWMQLYVRAVSVQFFTSSNINSKNYENNENLDNLDCGLDKAKQLWSGKATTKTRKK